MLEDDYKLTSYSRAKQRPKRAIGEHARLRLPDDIRSTVVYVYRGETLLGTAFLVEAPGTEDAYVVTAGHLVTRQTGLRLRVNTVAGGIDWVPIESGSWWETDDPHADLAVARWAGDWDRFQVRAIPWSYMADDAYLVQQDVGAGDEIAFLGLLQGLPGKDRNLPIIRYGHIARMAEELVPQRRPGGTALVEAIMVEARSWGGHSGSPAFVLFEATRNPGYITMAAMPPKDPRQLYALLGVVSGHWELPADVLAKNQPVDSQRPEAEVMVNAGIALVVPTQKLIDLVMREDLVADRRKSQETREEGGAASADQTPAEPP